MSGIHHRLQSCGNDILAFYRGDHVILGGLVSGSIFANRLLQAGVSRPIYIIYLGYSSIIDAGTKNLQFLQSNFGNIGFYLEEISVKFIGDNGTISITYYAGKGIHGEFISSYYVPRVGPWFVNSNTKNFQGLINTFTSTRPLTDIEGIVANKLAFDYNAKITKDIFYNGASILAFTKPFITNCGSTFLREIFQDLYAANCQAPNVIYQCYNSSLKIQKISADEDSLYNVMGDDVVAVKAQITWMADPYLYVKLHRLSTRNKMTTRQINDSNNLCYKIPAVYRAVLSIPLINEKTDIDLSYEEAPLGDLITSYLSFSLPDSCSPCQITWRGCCYTAKQDLSRVEDPILMASEGHTLLIIECVNLIFQRTVKYNMETGQVEVYIQNECSIRKSFANLVRNIFRAYTGNHISIETLLEERLMSNGNVETGFISIQPYITRRTPLEVILQLSSLNYGTNIFPKQYQT